MRLQTGVERHKGYGVLRRNSVERRSKSRPLEGPRPLHPGWSGLQMPIELSFYPAILLSTGAGSTF